MFLYFTKLQTNVSIFASVAVYISSHNRMALFKVANVIDLISAAILVSFKVFIKVGSFK